MYVIVMGGTLSRRVLLCRVVDVFVRVLIFPIRACVSLPCLLFIVMMIWVISSQD
jgi:hypothetical protein